MPPSTWSGEPKSMTQGSMPASCRMPTAPSSRVTSHMSADIIIGCTISTGGPAGLAPGLAVGREVPPQPVHRHALDDLEGRRHRAGLETAVAQHLQTVLGGRHQPPHGPGDRRKVHHDRSPFVRRANPPIRRHHGTAHSGLPGISPYDRRLMANLINLERATVGYGTRTLLDGVSLGVDEGDAIGVVGRNGDGKTTLAADPDRDPAARLRPRHPHLRTVGRLPAPVRRLPPRGDGARRHRRRPGRPHLGGRRGDPVGGGEPADRGRAGPRGEQPQRR